MKKWHSHVICGIACCLMVSACNGPIYTDGPMFMPDRITPRGRWLAVSHDLRDAANALDGDINTAAVSGPSYDGAELTIDLGKPCMFNMVMLEHGPDEFGFCSRLAVLTSDDGVNFRPQTLVSGLRRVTTIILPSPVLARYVRLQAVAMGARPWSIAEVHLN